MRIFVIGSSGMKVLTRNDLFNIMERSNATTFNAKLEFMEQELLNQYAENDLNIADIKQKLSIVRHQFKLRWSAARNTKTRFLENNAKWLKGCISLPKAGKLFINFITFIVLLFYDYLQIIK